VSITAGLEKERKIIIAGLEIHLCRLLFLLSRHTTFTLVRRLRKKNQDEKRQRKMVEEKKETSFQRKMG